MSTFQITTPDPTPQSDLLSLAGRCAIVTGGSRGIGEAVVKRLAAAGASVMLTGRGKAALQRVQEDVTASGGKAVGVQADVSSLNDSQRVVDLAVERFGGVDILVNNAAVFHACLATELPEDVWDATHDTDLKGAFFLAKAAAMAMIAAGRGGRIINVLTTDAFRPSGLRVTYAAAKAGLWAITLDLAKELAEHRIQVNAVTPGATISVDRIAAMREGTLGRNELIPGAVKTKEKLKPLLSPDFAKTLVQTMPLGRPGFPDDLAKVVLFLASDMAGYINGANIMVDGGQIL
ncbi:MAG: SDR family oxidoreductase [Desulfatitalea sp.]|nr:SDR family oxidoreductase [Desulfatitalea sp.]NNK00468.1 SDR family oxidoreductase [Desulfatitalea sp.]